MKPLRARGVFLFAEAPMFWTCCRSDGARVGSSEVETRLSEVGRFQDGRAMPEVLPLCCDWRPNEARKV